MSKLLVSVLLAFGVLLASAGHGHEQPALGKSERGTAPVIMYATATCGYCAQARAYFKKRGVQWEERDIDASAQARSEWKALGG